MVRSTYYKIVGVTRRTGCDRVLCEDLGNRGMVYLSPCRDPSSCDDQGGNSVNGDLEVLW